MEYTIRKMTPSEYPLLENFLYEAIFVPRGTAPPPKSILSAPELRVYVDRFGTFKGDLALAAEIEGTIIGAVWVRLMEDYGHLDDETPSLAISLYKEYRKQGIGTAMLEEMLRLLKTQHYKQVSLSVQKANYAAKLYQEIGFKIIKDNGEEWIMLYKLQ